VSAESGKKCVKSSFSRKDCSQTAFCWRREARSQELVMSGNMYSISPRSFGLTLPSSADGSFQPGDVTATTPAAAFCSSVAAASSFGSSLR
jgi:hypothetical protein